MVDKSLSDLVLESTPNISTEDLIKNSFTFTYSSSHHINISALRTIIPNSNTSQVVIELLHIPFFLLDNQKCSLLNGQSDMTNALLSYAQFNLRFIILNHLKIYNKHLIRSQSDLILTKPKLNKIEQLNLAFFFLFVTKSESEGDLNSKSQILFTLFDYNCLGFIESTSKIYLMKLRSFLNFFLYFSDSFLNYFLVKDSVKAENQILGSLIDKLSIDIEESAQSIAYFKKVLLFINNKGLKKEFVNYVSHNYIFEGENSNNKINFKRFNLNLSKTNYSVLNPSEMRKSLMRFVTKAKGNEFKFFLQEFPKIVELHNNSNDEIELGMSVNTEKKKHGFNVQSAVKLRMLNQLIKLEYLISSNDNFSFFKHSNEYKLKFFMKVKERVASSKFVMCPPSIAHEESFYKELPTDLLSNMKNQCFNTQEGRKTIGCFKIKKVKILSMLPLQTKLNVKKRKSAMNITSGTLKEFISYDHNDISHQSIATDDLNNYSSLSLLHGSAKSQSDIKL